MKNNNYNVDSKENLGHGIKGDINTANNLKNDTNNTKNKIANDKINKV